MTSRCTGRNAARALPIAFLGLALASPCAAQKPLSTNNLKALRDAIPYGQRTDAFRRLLYEFKFQPLKSFADLQANPKESVLIVLGDPSCLSKGHFPEGLLSFVQQGGAVMIATDMAVTGEARETLVELAGVTVTGETLALWMPPNPGLLYNGLGYCPFVQPLPDDGGLAASTNVLGTLAAVIGANGRPSLFRNPSPGEPDLRVATNAPSRLQELKWFGVPGIHPIARLPAGCEDDENVHEQYSVVRPSRRGGVRRGQRSAAQQEGPLFAVGGTRGKGRVLVIADHSIFINRMILPRDTGNLEFTANCLHWLRGGAMSTADLIAASKGKDGIEQLTGQRTKALFWDDYAGIRTDFHVPMREVPTHPQLPSTPALVAAFDQAFTRSADQYLAKKQETNALNHGLLEALDEHGWTTTTLGRSVVYILTFALLVFLGYRYVWLGRYQPDTAAPALGRVAAQHEPRASLIEQRRRAVLRAGNVWETAHQLARQCFESVGVPLTAAAAPRIVVQGSWWQRRRVRRRVERLWGLARGATPSRIPPASLKRWLRELEELKTALANGTILFNAECGMRNAE